MTEKAVLKIPAYLGVMEFTETVKTPGTQDVKLQTKVTQDLCIPYDKAVDVQSFYMLIGQMMESDRAQSLRFYSQNATEEEQKNFPVLYAGTFTKAQDGTVTAISRIGKFQTPLRKQDILFDYESGHLLDGESGEFDKSKACLERLFDFPAYAATNNPPQKTILHSETPIRETPKETCYPTRAEVNAANLKAKNKTYAYR